MISRITKAIVGVTAFVVIALSLPLAIVVQRAVISNEVLELEARSTAALAEIPLPLDAEQLAALSQDSDLAPGFTVYDATGQKLYGSGPNPADEAVISALGNQRIETSTNDRIIVAAPIIDRSERLVGALLLSTGRDHANDAVRTAWGVMVTAGLAAVGAAWLLGRRLARQLAEPIEQLAQHAGEMIDGSGRNVVPPSGIAEIDRLADALHESSLRTAAALARERSFSSDVSHQLRTPLTGIRLKLEAAHGSIEAQQLATSVVSDLDRVDATVTQLLALARDATPAATPAPLAPTITNSLDRWRAPLHAADRAAHASGDTDRTVAMSANSVGQILDVLIDNASVHGRGDITVTTRQISGGVAIDVSDEGTLPDVLSEQRLFERRDGRGHGIGLALARSLAEADDARLLLTSRDPTTFTLIVISAAGDRRATAQ